MRPIVTPEEMSRADEAAISAGTPAEELMDRAGRAVARAVIKLAGGRYGKKALVVCGKGNNGGDGFVAARVLHREGVGVVCIAIPAREDIRGPSKVHFDALVTAGVVPRPFDPSMTFDGSDVVIDAIFGTGFRGPAEGTAAEAIGAIRRTASPVVAVDIPSGVNGATGAVEGPAVRADVTVAIGCEKVGTASAPGAGHAGRVETVDVGIPIGRPSTFVAEAKDVREAFPPRDLGAHKGNVGSVAALAGSDAATGAALLTCRGAERTGAGYVRLGTVEAVRTAAAARLPEILTTVVGEGVLDGKSWDRFSDVVEASDVLAIGPGLGTGAEQKGLLLELLGSVSLPLVLDADALNNLAGETAALSSARAPLILTPHPGEMARLLDISVGEVQADRLSAAKEGARRWEAVVLLKGFRTVVATPDGTAWLISSGGPALASAGSGDVLTGVVAALVARSGDASSSAWVGAFIHGKAGDLAAELRGGEGVVAWDVAEALPDALRLLGP